MIHKKELLLLPNILTMSRISSIPILALLYIFDLLLPFIILYAIAGITDLLDGYIARKMNMITKSGQFLDSLADILFNSATALFLFDRLKDLHQQYQTLLSITITLGIIYLLVSIVKFRKVNFVHTNLFRLAGVLIYVCFIVSFFTVPVILTKITILLLCFSFVESICIYIVFGEVDCDIRYFWQLVKKKKAHGHTDD